MTREPVWQQRLKAFIDGALFRNTITALIVLNAVTLGLETFSGLPPSLIAALHVFDVFVVSIFVIELMLKLAVWRLAFFRSGWNIFDLVVVGVSVLPGSQAFQVLRALRVLRILRLLHIVPMLRRITEALLSALPGMGAIMAVLAILVYVGSVMATKMFGDTSDPAVSAMFGTLHDSAFTLFQVMTMDGWRNDVVQKVMDDGHPFAWVFFLIFIFIASFAVLNLFIALIVEALQRDQEALQEGEFQDIEDRQEKAERERAEILAVLKTLDGKIEALRSEDKKG